MPHKQNKIYTLKDAIGHLPSIDPYIKDVTEKELLNIFPNFFEKKDAALKISKWNNPPHHVKRQVITMMHTPTGKSAFTNKYFKPRKEDGTSIKGFPNTYKRQNWDSPAYAVTMDNVKISSQDNVHPGRPKESQAEKNLIYSDARVLTLFELMKVMSLPDNWPIPLDTSEAFIRRIIGEGIPPLFVKSIFSELKRK
jgi:DNA (cytosine-5)-methyltransferase 1